LPFLFEANDKFLAAGNAYSFWASRTYGQQQEIGNVSDIVERDHTGRRINPTVRTQASTAIASAHQRPRLWMVVGGGFQTCRLLTAQLSSMGGGS
jgi:hypothetical protein